MAMEGHFFMKDALFGDLTFPELGTFQAFSGKGMYRNRGGCRAIPNGGPIPPGKYWIVDRAEGSVSSRIQTGLKDMYNRVMRDAKFTHDEWFALYRADEKIDDWTWIDGIRRGYFRLHPGRISEGCITLPNDGDYATIRNTLLQTPKTPIPGTNSLMTYGTIEVISHDRSCR